MGLLYKSGKLAVLAGKLVKYVTGDCACCGIECDCDWSGEPSISWTYEIIHCIQGSTGSPGTCPEAGTSAIRYNGGNPVTLAYHSLVGTSHYWRSANKVDKELADFSGGPEACDVWRVDNTDDYVWVRFNCDLSSYHWHWGLGSDPDNPTATNRCRDTGPEGTPTLDWTTSSGCSGYTASDSKTCGEDGARINAIFEIAAGGI